jgi:hypothetical protein
MTANNLSRALTLLAVLPIAITAQVAREHDVVPLKHWAAPLYWQPAQPAAEERSVAVAASLPAGANALVFVAMTPCRVVDTRAAQGFPGAFGAPPLAGGTSRTFPIPSSTSCSIPSVAQAYSFNITVVPPGSLGFITAYPTGATRPLAATLNAVQGFIVGNAAVVPAGTNGSIDIFASDPTEIVIDINGYYAPLSSVAPGILPQGNTAIGSGALSNLSSGSNNTATGSGALAATTTGNSNIGIGFQAGSNATGSSNNIDIGNQGLAADNGVTRIGTMGTQSAFFAAGIRGVATANNDAIPVVIDSAGQLGTVSSSRRFKDDIADMGAVSSDLMRLRPVTFRYKKPFADGSKPIQYGLIAEEVAAVYPDLIARSADGKIETVKYQVLDSLLLNELQKEHRQVEQQAEMIRLLGIRLAALEGLLSTKSAAPSEDAQK